MEGPLIDMQAFASEMQHAGLQLQENVEMRTKIATQTMSRDDVIRMNQERYSHLGLLLSSRLLNNGLTQQQCLCQHMGAWQDTLLKSSRSLYNGRVEQMSNRLLLG